MITVSRSPVHPGIELRMPYHPRNRQALRTALGPHVRIHWDGDHRCWRLAERHMFTLINGFLEAGQPVRVEVTVRGEAAGAERCDERCRDARGDECVCACGGRWHGAGRWPDHWAHIETNESTIGVEVKYITRVYEVTPEAVRR